MKNLKLFIIILSLLTLDSCNELKLDNVEAERLVRRTLNLPQSYSENIGPGFGIGQLQDDGLITYNWEYSGWKTYFYLDVTEKGKPYFIGKVANKPDYYQFKTNDIDFSGINGISINKESQTATVRFSLKATNITEIAYSLKKNNSIKYSLTDPISSELIFKKFDNGWQLESAQTKSGSELVTQILNGSNIR